NDRHCRGRTIKGWSNAEPGELSMSPAQHLRTTETDFLFHPVFILYLISLLCAVSIRLHYLLSVAIGIGMVAYLVYLFVRVRPTAKENLDVLALIFSRFRSINTLYLQKVERRTLDVVRKTLGDIQIRKLVVDDKNCDKELRNTILKMVRKHKIETLTLCVENCHENKLREFFLTATENVKVLEIYEHTNKSNEIFGKNRDFWEKKAREMNEGSFSVQVRHGGERLQLGEDNHFLRFKV
ncbi:hypothetical protein PENTCL1PPCAC_16644, partial [Pristionchus entomophagus]